MGNGHQEKFVDTIDFRLVLEQSHQLLRVSHAGIRLHFQDVAYQPLIVVGSFFVPVFLGIGKLIGADIQSAVGFIINTDPQIGVVCQSFQRKVHSPAIAHDRKFFQIQFMGNQHRRFDFRGILAHFQLIQMLLRKDHLILHFRSIGDDFYIFHDGGLDIIHIAGQVCVFHLFICNIGF